METIKIENLTKIYDQGEIKVNALAGVTMAVNKGEFVSIMGASGSGKSTMMNMLGCLDRPTSGCYYLDGILVSSLNDNSLADIRNNKIGFVFQSYNLLAKLTALENVELPMVYAGHKSSERRKKALEALERVGLSDRLKHKPNEMSGGQKQRVAIARSLVNSPSIILADEPTGNLDSASTAEIIDLFRGLNESGATIVIVTHEPEVAVKTERIVTFRDGLIISDGPAADMAEAGGRVTA